MNKKNSILSFVFFTFVSIFGCSITIEKANKWESYDSTGLIIHQNRVQTSSFIIESKILDKIVTSFTEVKSSSDQFSAIVRMAIFAAEWYFGVAGF